jgi:hypothetical protein
VNSGITFGKRVGKVLSHILGYIIHMLTGKSTFEVQMISDFIHIYRKRKTNREKDKKVSNVSGIACG